MYVIKIGGGAAIGEAAYAQFAADLAELQLSRWCWSMAATPSSARSATRSGCRRG